METGLCSTAGNRIPLRGVDVTGELFGGHARVRVRQRYVNEERAPIEAVYTFPLPADATLVAFSMSCNGRRVEGIVKEREAAFRDYDDAISAGHGAALLDQERPNVFTAQVGNLLPREETVVEVEYLQRLRADEGALRWMIPTLVAPRYMPGAPSGDRSGFGTAEPTSRVPDADRISPPIADQIPYGLRLDLSVELPYAKVTSPSHALSVAVEKGRTRVQFQSGEAALDRDVVLNVESDSQEPLRSVLAHRDEGGVGVFQLCAVPDLFEHKATAGGQKVTFVVDVSGSMEGASIGEAKNALRLCLRHLREGDHFNVIAFNTAVSTFAPGLVPFTQRTLEDADRWAQRLRADGGTELLAPLVQAVQNARDGVVVLLTDGQVGNEDEILRHVLAEAASTRIYTFGIGTNVSDALLRELARRTAGACEFIHPGERIDEKVIAQFARAIAPRIRNLRFRAVGIESADIEQLAPEKLPDMVDGEPWTVFGRYRTPGSGQLHVEGELNGQLVHQVFQLDLPALASRPYLLKLWAAERIRDLEGAELQGRRAEAMKERIVKLAVEHQLATKYTSFVVVEQRAFDRRANGQPETRVVPVNAPAGWAMFGKGAPAGAGAVVGAAPLAQTRAGVMKAGRMPASMPAPAPAMASRASSAGPADKAKRESGAVYESFRLDQPAAVPTEDAAAELSFDDASERLEQLMPSPKRARRSPAPAPAAEVEDAVMALLSRQQASGLWDEPGNAPEAHRRVRATAKALLELLREGVNTAHALHGAQVKKAVEALVQEATKLAAADAQLAEFALAVAWLIASGGRTRGNIEKVVAKSSELQALKPLLGDEPATRKRVDQLASAV